MLGEIIQSQKEEGCGFFFYGCNLGFRIEIICGYLQVYIICVYVYWLEIQEEDYKKEEKVVKGAREEYWIENMRVDEINDMG